jgi:hypothetical protein
LLHKYIHVMNVKCGEKEFQLQFLTMELHN